MATDTNTTASTGTGMSDDMRSKLMQALTNVVQKNPQNEQAGSMYMQLAMESLMNKQDKPDLQGIYKSISGLGDNNMKQTTIKGRLEKAYAKYMETGDPADLESYNQEKEYATKMGYKTAMNADGTGIDVKEDTSSYRRDFNILDLNPITSMGQDLVTGKRGIYTGDLPQAVGGLFGIDQEQMKNFQKSGQDPVSQIRKLFGLQ